MMIDAERIGRSIKTMRERAGYTQKDLSERLFLSPMAVSKWERGLSIPDVSCLQRLAIVLDTDVDSILEASSTYMNLPWKGIIRMEDDTASSIIFDKPVIDYLLSYFLLSGIRHIIISAPANSVHYIDNRFGGGVSLGCSFSFVSADHYPTSLESLLLSVSDECTNHRVMFLTRPIFLYGVDLTRFFQRILYSKAPFSKLCTVKGSSFGQKIQYSSSDIPAEALPPTECIAQYQYSELPIYFFDYSSFSESKSISKKYSRIPMDKGFVDIDLAKEDGIRDASSFVQIVQKNNGYQINCPFEIAWRRGMINSKQLSDIISSKHYPEYTGYLRTLL